MTRLFTLVPASFLLLCLSLNNTFAQTGSGTLTGTVLDGSGALIPGVEVKATNTQTGVESGVITNESGVYNFPSLLPGIYTLSASLPGFQKQSYTNIELSTNESKRFNFTLQLASVAQTVDVTVDATTLLSQSSATIGQVLPDYKVRELPLLGTDVLNLIGIMGGVRVSAAGGELTTFAGINAGYVNTTINGLSVQDGRYALGVNATNIINPDLVGEIRLILTPVDAELGRGNGQVQIQTKSGTNSFTGSAVWHLRNTALDANSWANNRSVPPITPVWENRNGYTLSYGGPIVRNKTFFFVLWDQLITRMRSPVNSLVLTDCARNGIFRYFPDWNNGNAAQAAPNVPTTSTTVARAVVDINGNPVTPTTFRNGNPYNETLKYYSVYGPLPAGWTPSTPDCSDAPVPATAWDARRPNEDPTGFVRKALNIMPRANNFSQPTGGGDGLNTAISSWIRGRKGNDQVGFVNTQDETNRKQFNIKFDQNFSANHKLGVGWQYEVDDTANAILGVWPEGFPGLIMRRPQIWTANFTSTLRPTMVNEARFGLRRNNASQLSALDDPVYGPDARAFVPTLNGIPLYVFMGSGALVGFRGGPYSSGSSTFDATYGDITSLWNYADTLSWTKGVHAFKFGLELRRSNSDGTNNNPNVIPNATGGAGNAAVTGINTTNMPGLLGTAGAAGTGNLSRMENMLLYLSGSIGSLQQLYFLQHGDRLDQWENYLTEPNRVRDWHQNEWAAFIKDDWKISKDLTLNLGLRYEYYAPPYEAHGLTPVPVGGGTALWGRTGNSFEDWWTYATQKDANGNFIYAGTDLNTEYVGPNSPNPGRSVWNPDRNNFGPAVGFAWQVPWFGQGKTTVRGGYQVTFQGGGRVNDIDTDLGAQTGAVYNVNLPADTNSYIRLADFPNGCVTALSTGCIPMPLPIVNGSFLLPGQPVPVTAHNAQLNAYDPNYVAPYIQNFTLSVTRNVLRNMTVDVRYIGTRGIKLFESLDLNVPNFLTNGLKEAFDASRYGGESQLLNNIFNGLNIGGQFVNGTTWTGAMALRTITTDGLQTALASGNYRNVAATLATLNTGVPNVPPGVNGAVLRVNGFPENFILANPQSCAYTGGASCAEWKTNSGSSSYHALQSQVTLRPTNGMSYQGTFTWSRGLSSPASGGYSNQTDRAKDYGLQFSHRQYDFRSNGTLELPIGPNKLFFSNADGWVARLIERWQMSLIAQFTSGRPNTIGARSGLYGAGTPDQPLDAVNYFGNFPSKLGHVHWSHGQNSGNYFSDDPADPMFFLVPDPQCDRVSSAPLTGVTGGLQQVCRDSLNAIARRLPPGTTGVPGQMTLADGGPGLVVLQNSLPGERGNLGRLTMEGPGLWFVDASMSKTFQISEKKTLQFRMDARNLFNHPTPADPTLDVNSDNPFGNIATKTVGETPARSFQATVRLNF